MASNKGDVVLDPFCGCGTAVDASEKLERKWMGIDITYLAIDLIKDRMIRRYTGRYRDNQIEIIGEPKDLESARNLAISSNKATGDGRYEFQYWIVGKVGGVPANDKKKGKDQGKDGVISFNSLIGAIKVIISVKSGGTGSKDIRDLKGTMEREKTKFGLLLTLEEPTKDMKNEATSAGHENITAIDKSIPCIEILTVEEVLKGKRPEIYFIPKEQRTETTHKQAQPDKPNKILKGRNKKLAIAKDEEDVE